MVGEAHVGAFDGVINSPGAILNREKLPAGGWKKQTSTFDAPRERCAVSRAVMDDAGSCSHPENFISWEL